MGLKGKAPASDVDEPERKLSYLTQAPPNESNEPEQSK